MRYHWGLGIGHLYSHSHDIPFQKYPIPEADASASVGSEFDDTHENASGGEDVPPGASTGSACQDNTEDPSPGLENHHSPYSCATSSSNKSKVAPANCNDDLEVEESEPEEQDIDVDCTGSQCSSEDYEDNYNRNNEEDLELHDTYYSD